MNKRVHGPSDDDEGRVARRRGLIWHSERERENPVFQKVYKF
jgi:hypothetical protein